MSGKRIIAYGLLLAVMILLAASVSFAGTAQARYINTDSWFTSVSVAPAGQVTSDCLVEGGQTVLLGQMQLEELRIPFLLNSTNTTQGTLTWDVEAEKADFLQAGILLNGEAVTKLTSVELAAGENIADLQLIPTEHALTTVHEKVTVTVSVSWITEVQTITADFQVTLPEVTELPEEPSEPDAPADTEDPEETTAPTEPEDISSETEAPDAGDAQEPAVITESEETTAPTEPEETTTPTEPEETTTPTEPEETTTPTEPEETTTPTEPEETTTPTEPEETTTPTEPEETTTPTEPEETTTPTEPEETTTPTEPEETTPSTEPEETTPSTEPDVEPVSPVQILSLDAFCRENYLPVIITVPQGTDRVVLTGSTEAGAAAELQPFTRYSTDGGDSWYLLYFGGSAELMLQSATQATVLLDLSAVSGQLTQLDLQASAYAAQNVVGTAEHTAQVSDGLPITAGSRPWILSDKKRLVLQLNPAWSGCRLEYTVEMLTADENLETIGYVPVELSADTLRAVRDTQDSLDTLTLQLGKELPPAGSYRITVTWTFEDLCFATEQTSFFINYSAE